MLDVSPLKAIRSEAFSETNMKVEPHFSSKVRSTLHQLVRDWSEEGAKERDGNYGRIRRELARVLPVTASNITEQVRLFYFCWECLVRNTTRIATQIMRNKILVTVLIAPDPVS